MHTSRLEIRRKAAFLLLAATAFLISALSIPHQTRAAKVEGTNWIEGTASSSWTGRRALGAIANLHGDLWLLGGYNNGSPSTGGRLSDIWSSSDGINWTDSGASMPGTPRTEEAVLSFQGDLWILGGSTYSFGSLNDVWYSSDGTTWTEATSSAEWPERNGLRALAFNNKMWIMGGGDGSYTNDVWSSDDGVTWTEATSSAEWAVRGSFGATVFDNKMWVMGGSGASGPRNDVWYSTDGTTWTEATSSANWSARHSFAAVTHDNKMWVMGGGDVDGNQLSDVWYSTDGTTWTEATSSADWGVREFADAQDFNGDLWIFGGNSNGTFMNDTWYTANLYDLSFDSQGGSSISTISNQDSGASITLPSAPTRTGYSFQNWNTAADGSGTSYSASASYTMPGSNTTLYAVWQENPAAEDNSVGALLPGYCARNPLPGETFVAVSCGDSSSVPVSPAPASAANAPSCAAYPFTRFLKLGSQGEDVRALQKFLNCEGFTIATTGSGSSGNETLYFGSLTREALNRFQEAYASFILAPFGETKGTGIFATYSERKAAELTTGVASQAVN